MFILSTLLISCNKDTNCENYDNEFTVYLANADMNGLVPVIIDLEGTKTETKIKNILDVLKQGVEIEGTMASLPKEVEIKEIKVNSDNAVINFSSEYTNQINIAEVLLGRSSIVKSLIGLESVATVEFYVEGIPLKSVSGAILGKMGEDDIILNLQSSVEQKDITLLTLYFSNEDGTYLVPVEYSIALNPDEQLERTVLKLLIEGPADDDNLMRTIPVETKIKNISTNEGICTVDLSKDFVTSHGGGSTGETLTIYSIVNSLTELPNISKVKFLIEGEVKEQYKGHFMFNVLFEKNYDVLEKTE